MKTIEVKKPTAYLTQIGPAHPALKEPVMFTLQIEGERIQKADFVPGMAHRGIEWMGMRRNCIQVMYLAERICGICGITHSMSFARAVEQIAQIQVPNRAHYIRSIVGELERIHSHLLWAGVAAHELGFDSAFYLAWRVRENVMDLLEYLTGNRVHYAMIQIGGVRRDIVPDQYPRIEESMKFFEDAYDQLAAVFLDDTTVRMRCRDCGVLTTDEARLLCPVGPTARASGIKKDVRVDHPYAAYGDLEIDYMTPDLLTGEVRGDVYDRIITRLLEVKQSIGIVRQLLAMMPDGPMLAIPKPAVLLAKLKGAAGEAVGRHEAPRGEVMHYVRLDRRRGRTRRLEGQGLLLLQLHGLDPHDGRRADRRHPHHRRLHRSLHLLHRPRRPGRGGDRQVLTKEDLHRLSVEKTRRIQASLSR
jgi:membrane-bound hydrogenase subunit alpha